MSASLHERRLQQAAEAASLLYHAGARRVWLFGSIARGEVRDKRSDLDLAVEGLSDDQIQSLRRRLRALLRCKVDVVSMERALPELRQGILKCRVPVSRESCETQNGLARALPNALTSLASPKSFQESRIQAVVDALRTHGARAVLDLGCGPGILLERLAADPGIERVLGVDFSVAALEAARQRLGLGRDAATTGRVRLLHALATNPDPRFRGYDAVTAIEVIEHLDPTRLAAFARIVFTYLRPSLVIITTPNIEYNVRWNAVATLRRRDHRFEWTRDQFYKWVMDANTPSGYACAFEEIGTPYGLAGAPSQMAVCSRLHE